MKPNPDKIEVRNPRYAGATPGRVAEALFKPKKGGHNAARPPADDATASAQSASAANRVSVSEKA